MTRFRTLDLDYKIITKNVLKHVEDDYFLLLEKLVADVLTICSDHPDINCARVAIDKPHALRFADSISLTLEYHTDKSNSAIFSLSNCPNST